MMMGARTGAWAKSGILYHKLDWISSDGNCGIITDYCPSLDNARIDIEINRRQTSGAAWYSAVSVATTNQQNVNAGDYSFAITEPGNFQEFPWVWWDNGIWNCQDIQFFSPDIWYSISVFKDSESTSSNAITLKSSGETRRMRIVPWTTITRVNPVHPLVFFCRLPFGNSTPVAYFNIAKIRRLTIYGDHEGTLKVADFIPVMKDTTGEVGFINSVSGKFYGKIGDGTLLHGDIIGTYYI